MSKPITSGYSSTPLHAKLGIKPGIEVCVVNAPADYTALIGNLPAPIEWVNAITPQTAVVHHFDKHLATLAEALTTYRNSIKPDAIVWVSWPKKASKVPTDITEDRIRDIALPMGFVDIKVCAIDSTWSGLKLVIRRELR